MNNFFGRTIIPLRLGANRVAYATSVPSLISNRCAKINSLPRSVDGQGIIFSIGKNSSRMNLLRLRRLSDKPNPRQDVEKIIRVAKTNKTSEPKTFYGKFLGPKQMPERNTAAWYREMLLICTVFGITGSSTMLLVSFGYSNSRCFHPTCKLNIVWPLFYRRFVGQACCKRSAWHSRNVQRWALVLQNLLHCHYESNLCNASSCCGNPLWKTRLLSSFCGQDIQPFRAPARDFG